MKIKIIKTVKEMQRHADNLRRMGKRIALVPTMGFLHQGHLSLIREARKRADELVVSIFVNPAQFGPGEDLSSYPKSFERDLGVSRKEGTDAIFAPDAEELYPPGFQTYVTLENLPGHLCGNSRPNFFRGIATVVTKLFTIVKPHVAFFGKKDYQQLIIIRRMTLDLNIDVEIVGMPTVRESDGLAMSSRNSYLSSGERECARSLYASLILGISLIVFHLHVYNKNQSFQEEKHLQEDMHLVKLLPYIILK